MGTVFLVLMVFAFVCFTLAATFNLLCPDARIEGKGG